MKLTFMCSSTDAPLIIIILMIFINLFLTLCFPGFCPTSCLPKFPFSSSSVLEHQINIDV